MNMKEQNKDTKVSIIVGLGEILWDIFPEGKQMGGAPANFSYHVSQLGYNGIVASRVGDDILGKEILNFLKAKGLSSEYIQIDSTHPTGTVDVKLDDKRIPSYSINENVAWDYLEWNEKWKDLAEKADAVCFGSLCQRSKKSYHTIIKFLKHTNKKTLRIFDINLRQHYYSDAIIRSSLEIASILKLNEKELPKLLGLLGHSNPISEEEACGLLLKTYHLALVCLTKGEKGSLLFSPSEIVNHPGYKVKVEDTVGAGDAFTAALAVNYLKGYSINKINESANKIGSWVASQRGAMPAYQQKIDY